MRHALINQARFFFAADNLHRAAEDFLGFGDKDVGVNGKTQCRSSHDTNLRWGNILKTFSKQTQALPASFHRFRREGVVAVKPGGQTYFALNARQRLDAARHLANYQHMKTIGTEIDSCIERGGSEHNLVNLNDDDYAERPNDADRYPGERASDAAASATRLRVHPGCTCSPG